LNFLASSVAYVDEHGTVPSSPTVGEGLERLVRYGQVVNTAMRVQMHEDGEMCKLVPEATSPDITPSDEAKDAFLAAIVKMCRAMSNEHFAPQLVTFRRDDNGQLDAFVEFFQAPVLSLGLLRSRQLLVGIQTLDRS